MAQQFAATIMGPNTQASNQILAKQPTLIVNNKLKRNTWIITDNNQSYLLTNQTTHK
jgi:hypothetical protein